MAKPLASTVRGKLINDSYHPQLPSPCIHRLGLPLHCEIFSYASVFQVQ